MSEGIIQTYLGLIIRDFNRYCASRSFDQSHARILESETLPLVYIDVHPEVMTEQIEKKPHTIRGSHQSDVEVKEWVKLWFDIMSS